MKLKKKIAKKSQNSKKELQKLSDAEKPSPLPSQDLSPMSRKKELLTDVTSESNSTSTGTTNFNSDENFKKIIAESENNVKSAQIKAVRKDGRGRPALPRDANGNIIRNENKKELETSAPVNSTENSEKGSFLQAKEILSKPLQTISQLPARKHDIPELALLPEEADAICESIDKVVDAFLPEIEKMSPKTVAIVGATITIGMITFSKYLIFAEVQAARLEIEKEKRKNLIDQADEQGRIDQRESKEKLPSAPVVKKENPFMKRDAFSS